MKSQSGDQVRGLAELVARRSYGKIVAILASRTRDIGATEDALSEAFAAALTNWPVTGCPENPEAWLLTAARRKLIDAARRRRTREVAARQLQLTVNIPELIEEPLPDHRLGLLFACAHPAIDAEVRTPLMLQTIFGLDAKAIASAYLTTPSAMGKRLVRAKNKIRIANIPLEVPDRTEFITRFEAVLEAVYAAFGEGWQSLDLASEDKRDLSGSALFLARTLVELLPEESEAKGLLALALFCEARSSARRDDAGDYVPFEEQNTALWDFSTIREAENLLLQASQTGSIGRYGIEAAIQSAHVHRRLTENVNWAEVVQLYDALLRFTPSPVVAVNRAAAIAQAFGAAPGLAALDQIANATRLADYQPYWAVRASLLAKLGRGEESHRCYERAIELERDPAVRRFLEKQCRDDDKNLLRGSH